MEIRLTDDEYLLLRVVVWYAKPFRSVEIAAHANLPELAIGDMITDLNGRCGAPLFEAEADYWRLTDLAHGAVIAQDKTFHCDRPGYTPPQPAMCKTCIGRPSQEGGVPLTSERYAEIQTAVCQGTQHLCHSAPSHAPRACRHMSDLLNRILFIQGLIDAPLDEQVEAFANQPWVEDPFTPERIAQVRVQVQL